ncbi:MAG: DUF3108 domain-containing protein [Nitrospirae bacterium]|nr:DUF3108 domain-containing protein [Nitrospirota bacterium]
MLLSFPAASPAFSVPERLVFDLTWTGVKAGTAVLEVVDEKETVRVISTANSARWVSLFYLVDDRVETVLTRGKSAIFIGQPRSYRLKIREGRHRRDKEIIFDQVRHTALFIDHLGKDSDRKEHPVHENVFDPLSVLYYVRTMKLEVGKSAYVDIFDSKKLWNVEIQVLRKEKISTILGEVNAIVIKPLMKSEGIFNRKGEVLIWLTDDPKRIPVRMQTKVAVGAVTATLVGGIY